MKNKIFRLNIQSYAINLYCSITQTEQWMDCFELRKKWIDCHSDGLVRSAIDTGKFEGI